MVLDKQGKLELVEPSDEICASYLQKANDCFKSAGILLQNRLWENSVAMSYYSMYNTLQALLFKNGIKCENHAGAIQLLRDLLHETELHKVMAFAKKERIDKQYYITFKLTKESAQDLITMAEDFIIKIKTIIAALRNEQVEENREKLPALLV